LISGLRKPTDNRRNKINVECGPFFAGGFAATVNVNATET
jgi:hypothetical protein